jgi:hypothetical protein
VELFANEVHLATENALVTLVTEIVGVSGSILRDGRCVVVSTNLGRKLTSDHGHTAGSTKRRVAVRGFEDDGLLGQLIDVWRLDLRFLVVDLELGCRELIGHDVQDVRLGWEEGSAEAILAGKAHWRRLWRSCWGLPADTVGLVGHVGDDVRVWRGSGGGEEARKSLGIMFGLK